MLVVYCPRNPSKKDCFSEDLPIVNSKRMTMNHQQTNWVSIWPTWIVNWICSSHHFSFNNESFKTYPHLKLTHRLWNLIILGWTSPLRCPAKVACGAFAVGRFSSSYVPGHRVPPGPTSASLHKLLRKERWRMRHHLSHLHEAALGQFWKSATRVGEETVDSPWVMLVACSIFGTVEILSKVIFLNQDGWWDFQRSGKKLGL